MPVAASGDVTIYYETEGDPAGLPLLLVVGLGAQLTWGPPQSLNPRPTPA